MKKPLPPLNWLRSFDAAARHLNFTAAGKELNLTQAAISQQVKGLEYQLGVDLFKRLPRGLELTEAGQSLMPVVHESLEKLSAATQEMFGGHQAKVLTIKASLVFFTTWLAPRLPKFRERHPEVELRFSSNLWVHYNDNASSFDADIEIRYGQGQWDGVNAERLTWDELIPVCHPSEVNGIDPPVSLDQLENHTLLHVLGYEEGWGIYLKKNGYQSLEPVADIQFDTLISALEMAKLGQGIALGRSSLVEKMLNDGSLVAPFKESLPVTEAFYVCSSTAEFRHPHHDKFYSWIIEESKGT